VEIPTRIRVVHNLIMFTGGVVAGESARNAGPALRPPFKHMHASKTFLDATTPFRALDGAPLIFLLRSSC